jgi:hypothetical protein
MTMGHGCSRLGCEGSSTHGRMPGPTHVRGRVGALAVISILWSVPVANAAVEGCAVVQKGSIPFLFLHKAPANSEIAARLKPGDFLFVDSAKCETGGSLSICDKGNPRRWTHVTSVRRIDKGHQTLTRGWIRTQYVQWVRCEEH